VYRVAKEFNINGNDAIPSDQNRGAGKIQLQPGDHPFECFTQKLSIGLNLL
jgi:hypothetical protein